MCLPALAAIPAAVGAAGGLSTVATIASTGLGVFGALQQASAASAAAKIQQQQYKQQAEFEGRQANLEQMKGGYEARRRGEQLSNLAGQQRGQFAAAGVSLAGSPTDVIIDSQAEGALDLAALRFGTDIRTDNLRYSAGVASQNAAAAGQAAKTAWTTGAMNALSPIINLGRNDQFMTRLGLNF